MSAGAELIDTLWNVNVHDMDGIIADGAELIDTLWNVNFKKPPLIVINIQELIDTLWNVNVDTGALRNSITRINRYIMECK